MIYFLRHGQTDFNINKIYMGSENVKLNDEGRKQIKETTQLISSSIDIDLIISSTLDRAIESAMIVKSELRLNVPILLSDDIKERGLGFLEGKSKDSYAFNNSYEGVEDQLEFEDRVKGFFLEIKYLSLNTNILLVSHSHVYRAIENSGLVLAEKGSYLENADFSSLIYI